MQSKKQEIFWSGQEMIGTHLDQVFKENRSGFLYRGIDLRTAVEKKIYFKFLSRFNYRSPLTSILPFEIRPDRLHKKDISFWCVRVKHLLRAFRNYFLKLFYGSTQIEFANIIAHTASAKFLKYHKSIFHACGISIQTFSVQQFDGIDLAVFREERITTPKLRRVSPYLVKFHYDILVMADFLINSIASCPPEKIIVYEGNTAIDNLLASVAKFFGIPIICIQHGWAFEPHIGFRNLAYDQMLCWGKKFSSILKMHNPETRFLDVGYFSGNPTEEPKSAISIILQAPIGQIGQSLWNTFLQSVSEVIRQAPTQTFIVREHPSWPLPQNERSYFQYQNVRWAHKENLSLDEQLSRSVAMITIYSSVGFESPAFDCIPIFATLGLDIGFKPDLISMGAAVQCKTKEELKKMVTLLANDPAYRLEYRKKIEQARGHLFTQTGLEAKKTVCRLITSI